MTKKTALIALIAGAAIGAGGLSLFGLLQPEDTAGAETLVPSPFTAEPWSFMVSSCADNPSAIAPCVLVQAGGKRLVFGAPLHNDWRGIGPLDAIFLMDGKPESSAGVMGLRYETWVSGRPYRQALVTGELYLETLQALDEAMLIPDALVQMDSANTLDSRQAGFSVRPVPSAAERFSVFNTGDLQVLAHSRLNDRGDQIIAYRVTYEGQALDVYSCEGMDAPISGLSPDGVFVPVVDRVQLSEMRRYAEREDLVARRREILSAGLNCPSLTEARDYAQERSASALITVGVANPDVRPNFQSAGLSWQPVDVEPALLD